MPLIDFTKKDKLGRPTIVDPSKQPATAQDILEEIPEIDTVPTPVIDCSSIPDGRYGKDKVVAWFMDNGLYVDPNATKIDLIRVARALCAEQETS